MDIISSIDDALDESNVKIHIKTMQRNGKKGWTIIEGLDQIPLPASYTLDKFLNKLIKELKNKFSCGASIQADKTVIQLQGDHKKGVAEFLVKNGIVTDEHIVLHSF